MLQILIRTMLLPNSLFSHINFDLALVEKCCQESYHSVIV